jgi:hypothetical protein
MVRQLPDGQWLPVETAYSALGLRSVDALRGRIKRKDPNIVTRKVAGRVLVLVPDDADGIIEGESEREAELPIPLNMTNLVPEIREVLTVLVTEYRGAVDRAARAEADLDVTRRELRETKREVARLILRLDALEQGNGDG